LLYQKKFIPLFTNHSYKNKMMDKIVSFPHLLYKQAEIDFSTKI
jgi:hypothetical protein